VVAKTKGLAGARLVAKHRPTRTSRVVAKTGPRLVSASEGIAPVGLPGKVPLLKRETACLKRK
jgi:hypothetical protein